MKLLYCGARKSPVAQLSLFVLFVLVLCALPSPLISQTPVPQSSSTVAEEQDFAFSYRLYRDDLFQHALEQFNTFIEKHPNSLRRGEVEFLAIECRYQLEQYEAAVRLLTRYVQDYPSTQLTDDAYFRLGEAQLKLKNVPESTAAFKFVLDNFGDRELAGEAAYWIGEASVRIEDYDTALKYYTLAYEHYPNNRLRDYAIYSVAWTHQQKKDFAKAVEWYERLIKEFPQSGLISASVVRVGECYYYVKDYQKAVSYLSSAKPNIREVQEQAEADYLIAEAIYHLENYAEAEKRYEEFLAAHPHNKLEREVMYALGWSLMKQQKFSQAAEVFGRLTSGNDPLAHAGLYRRGVATKFAGDKKGSVQIFQDVVARAPRGEFSDNALYDAGIVLYDEKDYPAAKRFFEQVVNNYPASEMLPEAYRMAGECLVTESAFEPALAMFDQALAQPNASYEVKVGASYQAAWCLFKLKKYKESADRYAAFLLAYPGHPQAADASFWRGEALYQVGDYKAAVAAYQAITNLAASERKEEALYGIAWSYYKLSDFARARDGFERLLGTNSDSKFAFDARIRLGDCYFFSKDYKKAAAAYRFVTRQFAQRDGVDYAVFQLGQTYFRDGDVASASQQFTTLIQSYPKSALADEAQYALGWILFQRKEYADAIKEFQKVVASYPTGELVPRALYSVGDSHYNLQQYAEAEKAYRQLLDRFPKSSYVVDALSGIQYCLIAQGKQQEALQLIDTFVQDHPDFAMADELAMKKADLFYTQKQYVEAAREFRVFTAKYPSSKLVPTALYWNAKSLLALDRVQEAASTFERAAVATDVSPKIASSSLLEAGTIYFQQKQYDQALRVFSKIESSYSETDAAADASYLKGRVFSENGDAQEAKNQFEFVIQKHPSSDGAAQSKVALARIHQKAGDTAKAQTLADEVATSRNDAIGAEAQYVSATIFAARQEWQNAVTAFLRVRYVFPSYEDWVTKAYLGLGIAYENLKDIPKAKEAYQNVLRIKRDDPSVVEAQRRLKELERL